MADDRPVALIRFDEMGEMQLGIFGQGVRLVVIDERAPHDRVYEVTHREPLKALNRLVSPDEPIGHANEARHEAMVARMTALFAGKPHLQVVGGTSNGS